MTVQVTFSLLDLRLADRLATESADILRAVARKIEEGETFAPLFESKGNEVGTLRVTA